MDFKKIGKFIARKRQENNFTQEGLAEKLDVSDRAISKWERGICLPDANNMAKLCELFNVSYNELLSGEEIKEENYKKQAEKILKDFSCMETELNKNFFMYENIIGWMSSVVFLTLIFVASYIEMPAFVRTILIILSLIIFIVGVSVCIKIETEVGKYKCKHCGHLYIPKYPAVYFGPHFGRTRYMACPKCHKKSWQKKVA